LEATLTIAPAPPVKIEWRRAWRALRILLADAERTEQAFEIIAAVSGKDFERFFQRFVADPGGRALLAERPSLLAALSDRARLRALPPGSLGRAYAEFMDTAHLDPRGLVDAESISEAGRRIATIDPEREWLGHRMRDMHDLWHVLTGYGRDEAGEAANLAFSWAQTRYRGMGFIVAAIALTRPHGSRWRWPAYLHRAWRRGRRAAWLAVVPFERLLAAPLDDVRRLLAIEPETVAHPEGVLVAPHQAVAPPAAVAASGG
jgi:ubiquinone biosynthesis protein COQ4